MSCNDVGPIRSASLPFPSSDAAGSLPGFVLRDDEGVFSDPKSEAAISPFSMPVQLNG